MSENKNRLRRMLRALPKPKLTTAEVQHRAAEEEVAEDHNAMDELKAMKARHDGA